MRTIRNTKIEIFSVEQYETMLDLLYVLNRKFLIPDAFNVEKDIVYHYGDRFSRCEICELAVEVCDEKGGHDNRPDYDGDDIYSDESSYD